MNRYVYTGPTLLVGESGGYKLSSGMTVEAEVDSSVATVVTLFACGLPLSLDMGGLVVPAKYLREVKPEAEVRESPKKGSGELVCEIQIGELLRETLDSMPLFLFSKLINEAPDLSETRSDSNDCIGRRGVGKRRVRHDDAYRQKPSEETLDRIRKAARDAQGTPGDDIRKVVSYCERILRDKYGEG